MNARLLKETRQLVPAWVGAVVFVVLPVVLGMVRLYELAHLSQGGLLIVTFILGLAFLAVSSFGREFSQRTFQLLLSQPVSRARLWREKTAVLAIATATVWLFFWILFSLGDEFSPWSAGLAGVTAFAMMSTGLWTTLVFRQVVPALCFTLLLPAILIPLAGLVDDRQLPVWAPFAGLGVIAAYGAIGFLFGRWLFLRSQDGQAETFSLAWPERKEAPAAGGRVRGQAWSLTLKEIRLQQINILCGLMMFAVLGPLAMILAWTEKSEVLASVETAIALASLFMPLLFGAAAIAEERKLGTEIFQQGLPVTRRRQFLIKMAVAYGGALALGVILPLVVYAVVGQVGGVSLEGGGLLDFYARTSLIERGGSLTIYALFAVAAALLASSLARTTPAALLGAIAALFSIGVPLLILTNLEVFPRALDRAVPLAVAGALLGLSYWNYVRPSVAVRPLLWAISRAAGILLASVIVIWIALDLAATLMLRRSLAAWEEAGLAASIAELVPPPAPREGNAVVILESAIHLSPSLRTRLHRESKTIEELTAAVASQLEEGQVSDDAVDPLANALASPLVADHLSTAREAAAQPHFDAYLDYSLGFDLLIPHVGDLRNLARLLQGDAVLQAAQGAWADAYETLAVSFRMGEFLQDEPLLISQITRHSIRVGTFDKLALISRAHPPEEEILRDWQMRLASFGPIDFAQATIFDRMIATRWILQELEAGRYAPLRFTNRITSEYTKILDTIIFRPLHKADVAIFVNENRMHIARLRKLKAGELDLESVREWAETREEALPWYAIGSAELLHSGSRILELDPRSAARLGLARTALAVHAYRAREDQWPSTLAELVPDDLPALPRDPFGDGCLQYIREPGRTAIYSIGPNEQDDGGKDAPDDIVWVLEGFSRS